MHNHEEEWKAIIDFPGYSVSSLGRIMNDNTSRILRTNHNANGQVMVGMMQNGRQRTRTVSGLVARAFVRNNYEHFNTPIHLDADKDNCAAENLRWRPRWFANKYHAQFTDPNGYRLDAPFVVLSPNDGKEYRFTTSEGMARRFGVLEVDVVMSAFNNTPIFPTLFRVDLLEE